MLPKVDSEYVIIRPPIEANSILIPVTGGCSWNKCKFCGVYDGVYGLKQDYAIRPIEDVKKDIEAHHGWRHHSVFFTGGNPTSAPTEYLVEILKYVRLKIEKVPQISCYAKALDILRKTDDELRQLAEAGLDIVYMGLESGDSEILRIMRKGTNAESIIKAGKRILNAGIKLSLYVILGLGGKGLSEEHIRGTAKALTEINPTIFRFRTLNILPTTPLWNEWKSGEFERLSPFENMKEERNIIAALGDNVTSQVFNDHVSNYFTKYSLNIEEDRDSFLKELDSLLSNPRIQKMAHKKLTNM